MKRKPGLLKFLSTNVSSASSIPFLNCDQIKPLLYKLTVLGYVIGTQETVLCMVTRFAWSLLPFWEFECFNNTENTVYQVLHTLHTHPGKLGGKRTLEGHVLCGEEYSFHPPRREVVCV